MRQNKFGPFYWLLVSFSFGISLFLASCDRQNSGNRASSPEGFPQNASRHVIVRSDPYGQVQYAFDQGEDRDETEWRRRIEQEHDRYEWQDLDRNRRIEAEFPSSPEEDLYFIEDSSQIEAPDEWGNESYWDEDAEIVTGGYGRYRPGRRSHHRWRSYGCSRPVGYYRIRNYCYRPWRHYYPYTHYYRQPRWSWSYHPTYYWMNSFYYYRPVVRWRWGYWSYYTYSIWW